MRGCNTASALTNCSAELTDLAEVVRHNVWQVGGVPLELPTISLCETFLSPTSLLYRNLATLDAVVDWSGGPITR